MAGVLNFLNSATPLDHKNNHTLSTYTLGETLDREQGNPVRLFPKLDTFYHQNAKQLDQLPLVLAKELSVSPKERAKKICSLVKDLKTVLKFLELEMRVMYASALDIEITSDLHRKIAASSEAGRFVIVKGNKYREPIEKEPQTVDGFAFYLRYNKFSEQHRIEVKNVVEADREALKAYASSDNDEVRSYAQDCLFNLDFTASAKKQEERNAILRGLIAKVEELLSTKEGMKIFSFAIPGLNSLASLYHYLQIKEFEELSVDYAPCDFAAEKRYCDLSAKVQYVFWLKLQDALDLYKEVDLVARFKNRKDSQFSNGICTIEEFQKLMKFTIVDPSPKKGKNKRKKKHGVAAAAAATDVETLGGAGAGAGAGPGPVAAVQLDPKDDGKVQLAASSTMRAIREDWINRPAPYVEHQRVKRWRRLNVHAQEIRFRGYRHLNEPKKIQKQIRWHRLSPFVGKMIDQPKYSYYMKVNGRHEYRMIAQMNYDEGEMSRGVISISLVDQVNSAEKTKRICVHHHFSTMVTKALKEQSLLDLFKRITSPEELDVVDEEVEEDGDLEERAVGNLMESVKHEYRQFYDEPCKMTITIFPLPHL